MTDSPGLQDELVHYNGGPAEELARIYTAYHDDGQFVDSLIAAMSSLSSEHSSSWLLKRYLEQGSRLNEKQTSQLFALAPQLQNWQATLHLLQMLPMIDIPADSAAGLETFLHHCLQGKNKFLRAWAYGGFYRLGQQHEQYRSEAEDLLDRAMQGEPPAIKARIRRLRNG